MYVSSRQRRQRQRPRSTHTRTRTRQIKASYVPFYRSSLLFLACIDLDKDLSKEERVTRAHDLGVAALLGDSLYNFGELVSVACASWGTSGEEEEVDGLDFLGLMIPGLFW